MAAKTTLELVRAHIDGRRVAREYPFPGVDGVRCYVKSLTDEEVDGCRLRAAKYCEERKASMLIDPEMFDRALRRELISMAYYAHEDKPLFGSARDVGELDDSTVTAVHQQYLVHHELCQPWVTGSDEEVEALTDALGKSDSSAGGLSLFDAPTLRRLLLSMARKARATSQTSK